MTQRMSQNLWVDLEPSTALYFGTFESLCLKCVPSILLAVLVFILHDPRAAAVLPYVLPRFPSLNAPQAGITFVVSTVIPTA